MQYEVSVVDFINTPTEFKALAPRKWRFRSLEQAWRKATKLTRRGFNLYGGGISYQTWGSRGGALDFCGTYRSVVIGVR